MHYDPPPSACACTMLRKANRALGRIYDEALARHHMTTAQFSILRTIARGQPLALSRLAEQLVMDRTSLYRALAPIEKRGWVAVSPGGGRTKLATLTAAGHAAMQAAEPAWQAVQARVEAGMDASVMRGLDLALQILVRSAEGGRA